MRVQNITKIIVDCWRSMLFMICFSVVLFFLTKMYVKTWIPLLFITYCFGVNSFRYLMKEVGS